MINAIQNMFASSQRQPCIKHKIENILGYVPEKQQELVRPELKAIFYLDNRQKADQLAAAFIEKYTPFYPSAIDCLKRDWDSCLTFYSFPSQHWKFIRTTNVIARLFGEVEKRSHKMAAAFRNEKSCMLMFYAVVRSLKLRRITVPDKVTNPFNFYTTLAILPINQKSKIQLGAHVQSCQCIIVQRNSKFRNVFTSNRY